MVDFPSARALDALLDIVHSAGKQALRAFHRQKTVRYKHAGEIVTDSDPVIEGVILRALRKQFPAHRVVGEETGAHGPESEYAWFVDPIDGTRNFATGVPHFNVSVGLALGGKPVLGAVYDPVHDEMFSARAGAGAFLNRKKIRVGKISRVGDALVIIDYARESIPAKPAKLLKAVFSAPKKIRVKGALAMDLCHVAAGKADALLTFDYKPHKFMDIAAGWIILAEAGGAILSWSGKPFTPDTVEMIAGNPALARNLVQTFAPLRK